MTVYLRARLPGYRRGLKRGRVMLVADGRIYVAWDGTDTKSCFQSWANLLRVI